MTDPHRVELRVVRGQPDERELAALVTVLATVARPGPARPGPPRSAWTDRGVLLRAAAHARADWARSGRTSGVRTRADW